MMQFRSMRIFGVAAALLTILLGVMPRAAVPQSTWSDADWQLVRDAVSVNPWYLELPDDLRTSLDQCIAFKTLSESAAARSAGTKPRAAELISASINEIGAGDTEPYQPYCDAVIFQVEGYLR